ncbi:MAG TPA: M20/M25/M40 family metallo-hydrolase [Candidatus Polarisedimenticolaceae bacterium]|nr:M20/M25/M40 family metallo-hydrolase [Candidatus Polarisedimenticolaceae bacterium]
MTQSRSYLARRTVALLIALLPVSALAGDEKVDLATVHRIKDEAFRGSKVMEHLFFLTDANGPRLTNSPGQRAAADWAVRTIKSWGIDNAHQETWGKFGRGWSLKRFTMNLEAPVYAPLQGVPLAWSSGTNGVVSGEPVVAVLFGAQEMEKRDDRDPAKLDAHITKYIADNKGKLHGKFVLLTEPREMTLPTEAESHRLDEKELGDLQKAPEPIAALPIHWPITSLPDDPKKREQLFASAPFAVRNDLSDRLRHTRDRLNTFFKEEGVAAVLSGDSRGMGGILFAEAAGSYEDGAPIPPPRISLAPESYDRLCRLVDKKIPVRIALDMEATFDEKDLDGKNVVAEIEGGSKKDEVVMLGAHLDSWHSGTGATDNAAGSAVVLEAMRILKTLGLKMDRTVRLGLWTGEEQGILGSSGYVTKHFADMVTMRTLPEHAKLSGYFNIDNGTGKIRGVYLQGNDMMRPIFAAWLAPFEDLGAKTISIHDTGGTDHLPFDAVGLPGFQFIQDPLDYSTRTHHSNVDVYDHVQAADLMQAAAILASVVYDAATRPEMLPRKPMPKPLPPKETAPAR